MAEAIIKYSRLVSDDGGFDKLRKDLDLLGDDLKKKANEFKGIFSFADPNDNKGIEKLQGELDVLKKAYKELGETQKMLEKAEKEYNQQQKKTSNLNENSLKDLDELNKLLGLHKQALKSVNIQEKEGTISMDEASKQRGRLNLVIKETNKAINQEQKEILEKNKLSKKEKSLIEAQIVLDNKRVDTLDEIYERMKALRVVIKATNINTTEGKEAVAEMNREINELSEVVSENSDKFIQNKINIGNYKESIVEALEEQDLFKTNIALLDGIIGKLVGVIKKNTKATEKNTIATKKNTKAVAGLRKGFKLLKNVMKASVIFLIIGALASLVAMFKQGRAGVIKTQKAMAVFNATSKVVINTLADFGSGLVTWLSSLGTSFDNLGLYIEKLGLKWEKFILEKLTWGDTDKETEALQQRIIALDKQMEENSKNGQKKSEEGWNKMKEAISGYKDRLEDAKNSTKTAFQGIIDSFKIADAIRSAKLELIGLKKELSELEMKSDDATTGLRTQLEATRLALIKGQEVFKKEEEIARMQVALANAKARADLQSAETTIGASASKVLAIKDEIEFAQALLKLNQNLDVTKNPLDDSLLDEQQQALQEFLEKQSEYDLFKLQSAQKTREINLDIFEQDLDLFIDLIDKKKNLSEQYVNDISRNFQNRVLENERFFKKFAEGTKDQLDLFSDITGKGFTIEYFDDGSFDLFLDDQRLATDNIKELNEQLQSAEIPERVINRFREFIQETESAEKDFKDLNKTLSETAIKIQEISGEDAINENELEAIRKINDEYEKLNTSGNLSGRQKAKIIEKIKELEKEKTKVQSEADKERLLNRLDVIEQEKAQIKETLKAEIEVYDQKILNEEEGSARQLELIEQRENRKRALLVEGSEKEIELNKEATEIQTQLEDKRFDNLKNNLDDVLSTKSEWQQFGEELKQIFADVLDKFEEVQEKQVQLTKDNIDKQEDAVDKQRERAEEGLSNTLAFEQRELAKREGEKIKEERKLERIRKIKALYTSYTNYASDPDEGNAIAKALRDFAILEAITASFKEGGLTGIDGVQTNSKGITTGKRHNLNGKGGNLAWHERGEGFFSRREVANMGEETFYKIKSMASMGKIDSEFFNSQKKNFVTAIPLPTDNSKVVSGLEEVKRTIENKPVSSYDFVALTNGIIQTIETTMTKNKTSRNIYKSKKPKL